MRCVLESRHSYTHARTADTNAQPSRVCVCEHHAHGWLYIIPTQICARTTLGLCAVCVCVVLIINDIPTSCISPMAMAPRTSARRMRLHARSGAYFRAKIVPGTHSTCALQSISSTMCTRAVRCVWLFGQCSGAKQSGEAFTMHIERANERCACTVHPLFFIAFAHAVDKSARATKAAMERRTKTDQNIHRLVHTQTKKKHTSI